MKPTLLALIALMSSLQAAAADNAVGIGGFWVATDSRTDETILFSAAGEFAWTYTDSRTTPRQSLAGAYKLSEGTCFAGEQKGNLWLTGGSLRCCFRSYPMGKTLVLDEVGTNNPLLPPTVLEQNPRSCGGLEAQVVRAA